MHLHPIPLREDTRLSLPDAGRGGGRLPLGWLLLLAAGLAASAVLPTGAGWLVALAAIILLGVPHGALDGEVARPVLRPRFGRAWFLVFSLPYLSLSALVLLAWSFAQLATLAAFLAVSVWHFGEEDAGQGAWPEMLVRGGLPIAMPVLVHPAATAEVLGTVALVPLPVLPAWLTVACWAWLGLAVLVIPMLRNQDTLFEIAGLATVFTVLPPLSAFALYFIGFHAPRHMAGLAADPMRAPRVGSMRAAALRAVPVTGLTLLLGALLWFLYPGPAPQRLLALTLQGLAALTLPHLVLSHAPVERWSRRGLPSVSR